MSYTQTLTDEQKNEKIKAMAKLLLECRDALPAISIASARLHHIDLTLADRIEDQLAPWKIEEPT